MYFVSLMEIWRNVTIVLGNPGAPISSAFGSEKDTYDHGMYS